MKTEDKIRSVAMAIQELSNLIMTISSHPEYSDEQAASYYDKIFEMHRLRR